MSLAKQSVIRKEAFLRLQKRGVNTLLIKITVNIRIVIIVIVIIVIIIISSPKFGNAIVNELCQT